MAWLAFGLPAHVLVKALSPAFYACENTIAPLLATLKAIAVAIVLGVLLGHWFGTPGIAAAIALGAWSNALSLVRAGAATFGFSIDAAAYHRLPRILASALAMGALLWLATGFLPIAGMQAVAQMIALLILIAGAIAVYGLFLALLGATSWREVVNAIRQNRAA
jgi:putative peptidoglycan lipid II flippase